MKKQRLETFGDAIIAIVLTLLVLKLTQPSSATLEGFLSIKESIFAYLISFLIIFNVWYNNHNFFHALDEIDDSVVWMQGFTLFMMSLLPYFTSMVANNINSLIAESLYGLTLIFIHIFYILTVKMGIKSNNDNKKIIEADYLNKNVNLPVIVIIIGYVLAFMGYPYCILISCLITVCLWIITFRHFKDLI